MYSFSLFADANYKDYQRIYNELIALGSRADRAERVAGKVVEGELNLETFKRVLEAATNDGNKQSEKYDLAELMAQIDIDVRAFELAKSVGSRDERALNIALLSQNCRFDMSAFRAVLAATKNENYGEATMLAIKPKTECSDDSNRGQKERVVVDAETGVARSNAAR